MFFETKKPGAPLILAMIDFWVHTTLVLEIFILNSRWKIIIGMIDVLLYGKLSKTTVK
jgi:hypothetical protein